MPATATPPKGTPKLALGITAVVLVLGVLMLAMLPLLLGGQQSCGGGGADNPPPSADAQKRIPANYLADYRAAGAKYGIPWYVLAGVGQIETDHGRLKAPGVTSGANSAGAGGPMQFLQGTWNQYGVDGNHDGKKDRYDPDDAIPGAARYLKASGAPGDLHRAIFAYNHADWYVAKVMANARSYAGKSAGELATAATGGGGDCSDGGGTSVANGKWKLAPGANAPGRPLTGVMTRFVNRAAGAYPLVGGRGELVLTAGTNHSKYSTSGLVSDHYSGNAGDFGMVANHGTNDSPTGDHIAAAFFMAAGLPRNDAIRRGRQGGLQNVTRNGARVQIIWKTYEGGDHHNHVHAGIKPSG